MREVAVDTVVHFYSNLIYGVTKVLVVFHGHQGMNESHTAFNKM